MAMPKQPSDAPTTGWAIWLTGLPASGKSTIARLTQERLQSSQVATVILDSDALRPILAPHAGYDEAGRLDFYTRLVELAGLLVAQGLNVIVAATGNRRAYRDAARARLSRFAEVWVKCPVEECSRRDVKGLYKQAHAGTVHNLPGVDLRYEMPLAPALILDTTQLAPTDAAAALLNALPRLFD